MSKTAWVLKDYRAGNTTQSLALAQRLDVNYQVKNIEYNYFAQLPNYLLYNLWHVNKKLSDRLDGQMPDVIISAGRRLALVAAYLKRNSAKPIKIINIMRPNMHDEIFDYIIVPEHDNYPDSQKIIKICGSLNSVADNIQRADPLYARFPNLHNFVGVLVGGNTRGVNFTEADNEKLLVLLTDFFAKVALDPVITFSRRTPEATKKLFSKVFASDIIYDPLTDAGSNIYYSILKSADYIICTGDSISMCSEVVSSGKPCFIYPLQNSKKLPKHMHFINNLVQTKRAKILGNQEKIEPYFYHPLDELTRIVPLIKL